MGGIFGVFNPSPTDAADLVYLGLYALQHRGQESAGMAVSDTKRIQVMKGAGLVSQRFDDDGLARLRGGIGLGHVRYSAAGATDPVNTQPLYVASSHGDIAVACSGRLTNGRALRRRLLRAGAVFQTAIDAEVIINLIAQQSGVPLEEAVLGAVQQGIGGYTLGVMTNDRLIGVRDPLGIRPLSIGRQDDTWFLTSESSALDTVGAQLVRDLVPGEIVVIDEKGPRTHHIMAAPRQALCVFEYIYFARTDSVIAGKTVHEVRKEIGRMLARQHPIEADLVVPAPDSAISATLGYAEEAGIPFDVSLAKNRYVGRTFIQPTERMRQVGVRIKLNPIRESVRGRRVILVDDSIVRGTTSAKMIEILRNAGASEVHMAVASPPFSHPCHYGIDVPNPDQLIASHRTVEEVRRLIGADTLTYLSFESLYKAVGMAGDALCAACFGAGYPTEIPDESNGNAPGGEGTVPK